MKRLRLAGIVGCLVILALFVCFGTYYVTNKYLLAASAAKTIRCSGQHQSYRVTIQNGVAIPHHIDASLCDTLTITNLDDRERLIAFGPHSDHITYDGISERILNHNQSLTVVLIEPGTFLFHDHLDYTPLSAGSFTVRQ